MAEIVYLSHGGGPLPILGDPGHHAMVQFMKSLPAKLRTPEAILVVSAHWEENVATVLGNDAPSMFYDYYGFPREAYEIVYGAPGHPDLAHDIVSHLKGYGIDAGVDGSRGFDHGLFIPLLLMYPEAKIPAIQLSLLRGLDAKRHIEMGKALRHLCNENLLVIGSGFSYHNLNAFNWRGNLPDARNDAFQDWLIETCTSPMSSAEREARLVNWEQSPHARYCHPREEHLLPLHVCQGMAETEAEVVFDDSILGKRSVAFLWKC